MAGENPPDRAWSACSPRGPIFDQAWYSPTSYANTIHESLRGFAIDPAILERTYGSETLTTGGPKHLVDQVRYAALYPERRSSIWAIWAKIVNAIWDFAPQR